MTPSLRKVLPSPIAGISRRVSEREIARLGNNVWAGSEAIETNVDTGHTCSFDFKNFGESRKEQPQ
jgi:hypothetical protein